MKFLIFQLQGAMSSWGETAVGEFRGTCDYPGESTVIGLLGAALGIRRDDETGHAQLKEGYGFAVGVQSTGRLLRDYHTIQVPGKTALRGRVHRTRRDELAVSKENLKTIVSTRDFRQEAASLVAVQAHERAPYALETLAESLRKPCFVLYLGRKACPPAAPLNPTVLDAESVLGAFKRYCAEFEARRTSFKDQYGRLPLEPPGRILRLVWSDGVQAGVPAHLSTQRKDRVIRRHGWQFGDRTEHIAVLAEGV